MPQAQAGVAIANDSEWHTLYNSETAPNRQVKGVVVGCNATSTGTRLKIRIKPIHDGASDFPVYKGAFQQFEHTAGIELIEVMAVGGACVADWGVFKDDHKA